MRAIRRPRRSRKTLRCRDRTVRSRRSAADRRRVERDRAGPKRAHAIGVHAAPVAARFAAARRTDRRPCSCTTPLSHSAPAAVVFAAAAVRSFGQRRFAAVFVFVVAVGVARVAVRHACSCRCCSRPRRARARTADCTRRSRPGVERAFATVRGDAVAVAEAGLALSSPHRVPCSVADATLGSAVQSLPHSPQCDAPAKSASQPLPASPSQSPKPSLHRIAQLAFAAAAAQHVRQTRAVVAAAAAVVRQQVLVSQPSRRSSLQSARPESHCIERAVAALAALLPRTARCRCAGTRRSRRAFRCRPRSRCRRRRRSRPSRRRNGRSRTPAPGTPPSRAGTARSAARTAPQLSALSSAVSQPARRVVAVRAPRRAVLRGAAAARAVGPLRAARVVARSTVLFVVGERHARAAAAPVVTRRTALEPALAVLAGHDRVRLFAAPHASAAVGQAVERGLAAVAAAVVAVAEALFAAVDERAGLAVGILGAAMVDLTALLRFEVAQHRAWRAAARRPRHTRRTGRGDRGALRSRPWRSRCSRPRRPCIPATAQLPVSQLPTAEAGSQAVPHAPQFSLLCSDASQPLSRVAVAVAERAEALADAAAAGDAAGRGVVERFAAVIARAAVVERDERRFAAVARFARRSRRSASARDELAAARRYSASPRRAARSARRTGRSCRSSRAWPRSRSREPVAVDVRRLAFDQQAAAGDARGARVRADAARLRSGLAVVVLRRAARSAAVGLRARIAARAARRSPPLGCCSSCARVVDVAREQGPEPEHRCQTRRDSPGAARTAAHTTL